MRESLLNRLMRNISISLLLMGSISTTKVFAEEPKTNTAEIDSTVEISRQRDISEQLKEYATKGMTPEEKSKISIKYSDLTDETIQTVKVEIYKGDSTDKSLLPFETKNIMVKLVDDEPVIKLKRDRVIVNNGDAFNPSNYISYINSDNNILPALEVKSDVNTAADGEYTVNYRVTDLKGVVTEKTLQVSVQTHPEVIEKQEQERALAEQAEQERLEQERQEQLRQQSIVQRSSYNPIPFVPTATGNEAVDRALSFVGYSYIWGSNNPANGGFDCSGLVQYCYGIGARTTYDQRNLGTHRYDVWNAPAGALYFYNNDSHVAIATGGGGTVQAMNESVGVTTQSIGSWMPDYYVIPGQ